MRWFVAVAAVVACIVGAVHWATDDIPERVTRGEGQASSRRDPKSTPSRAREEEPAEAELELGEAEERTRTTRFVVTSESRAIGGAYVTLPDHELAAMTDANGEVVLVHPDGAPSYVVRKLGYQTFFGDAQWRGEEGVSVTLIPGTPARGRVVSKVGARPLEGAHVSMRTCDDPPEPLDVLLRTDADGTFTIAGLGDEWPKCLAVNLAGFAPIQIEVEGLPFPQLVLGDGGRIEGVITDARGNPVADAAVVVLEEGAGWLLSREDWERPFRSRTSLDKMLLAHAFTDEQGRYSIRGLERPYEYSVAVFGKERGSARVRGIRLLDDDPVRRLDATLAEGVSLRLVVKQASGEDLSRVVAMLEGVSEKEDGYREVVRWSERHEAWFIDDVMPGTYNLTVEADGCLPSSQELVLAAGARREVSLELKPGLAISGRLVDSKGAGVPGMAVYYLVAADPRRPGRIVGRTVSREDGSFEIGGLGDVRGTLSVTEPRVRRRRDPEAPLGKFAPHRVEKVAAGGAALTVVLPAAPRIVGQFGPSPSWVQLEAIGKRMFDPSMEREKERFTIARLPVGVAIDLRFEASGFARVDRTIAPLRAGEVRDIGKVQFGSGLVVSGTVKDDTGAAVEGAKVLVAGGGARGTVTTDDDGRFRVPNLTPDVFSLWVTAEGYVERIVRLPKGAGLKGLSIVLTKGGMLVGRVRDAGGEPAAGKDWSLSVLRQDETDPKMGRMPDVDAASSFSLRLEAGTYFLILEVWKGKEATEGARIAFEIRKGVTTKLDVTRK